MNIHFVETENLKECISIYRAEDRSQLPLFHGTRMYALQASEEERNRFYRACDRVISFAKQLLKNRPFDDDTWEEYLIQKNPMFLTTVVCQYETPAYSYGDFYVTTDYTNALVYAGNCGGELGQWAQAQCIGFRDFQIEPDPETAEAASIVMEEYEKYEKSEPVVLVFTDVRFADLKTERGAPFLIYDKDGKPDEEYNAFSIEMLYQTQVTDHLTSAGTYRLMRHNTYTAQLVRQKDFKKGLSVFTEIRDVDKYLKGYDMKRLRDLVLK